MQRLKLGPYGQWLSLTPLPVVTLVFMVLLALLVTSGHGQGGAPATVKAAPAAAPAAAAPPDSDFRKVILDQNVNGSLVEPLDMEVLPDGRVIYVTRPGVVKVWRPATSSAVVAATLSVSTQFEDGLSGIIQDPSFATNRWVYLYYMASDVAAARVSRFTMSGDTLQLASEVKIIEWSVVRGGGHTGGGLAFDESGNLFIATGDNVGATGYMQPAALATSANSNDLRGKILRIRPRASGGYDIPAGNMFPPGTAQTRPEIYAMGMRNPYRIAYDPERRRLYVGDVGPDAGSDSGEGPRGHDEYNIVDGPGFYGWPMCIANNRPYAGQSCTSPVNSSGSNSGLRNLPPAKGAWIWYHGGQDQPFPQMESGGRTAIAGPTYHFDPGNPSPYKLPAYYDDAVLIAEFTRDWIKELRLDAGGNLLEINNVARSVTQLRAPIALDIGPDGALYVLEYAGWFNGTTDTRLSRIEYTGRPDHLPPLARASSTPDSGMAPLTVQFSSAGSSDPEGLPLSYAWDFDGNGTTDSTAANPSFTYTTNGTFNAQLTVRDTPPAGATAQSARVTVPIVVGNTRPVVDIVSPAAGAEFRWGQPIGYEIRATDADTPGGVDCARVVMQPAMGHDDHAHPLQQIPGCSGSFTPETSGHNPYEENIFIILSASYADQGSPPLTGSRNISLRPIDDRPACDSANVARGKPVTASSTESGSYPAANAVDGSATSRWASQFGDPQWIQVDLGTLQNVCRVRLYWEAAYGKDYAIQTSPDGATWTTARAVTGGDGGSDDHANLYTAARYVRIYGTARGTTYGYSLYELEIYTAAAGPTPTATRTSSTGPSPTLTTRPADGALVLDDFEGGSLSAWSTFRDAGSTISTALASPGQLGGGAMRVTYSIAAYAGVQQTFGASRSWTAYDGIRFGFNGANSGATLRLEVIDNSPNAGNSPDAGERWVYTFADNLAGWRTISVPWSAFTRRADWQPAGAPNDGFGRGQVWGFSLAPLSGSASFQLDQVELYGPPPPTWTPTRTSTAGPTQTSTATRASTATRTSTTPPAANLLKNGGFETDADANGKPDSWAGSNSVATSSFSRSSAARYAGSYSLRHLSSAEATYMVTQVVSGISAGSSYTFSGWTSIPATGDAFSYKLELVWRNASNATLRTDLVRTYSAATSGWSFASATRVAPAGATSVVVRMNVAGLSATIYADAFNLKLDAAGATRTPTNTRTATAVARGVAIVDGGFQPASLTINPGETVRWVNSGAAQHNVVGSGWSSPVLAPGGSYERTFTQAGTFSYVCGLHPSMTGAIVVGGAPSNTATTTATATATRTGTATATRTSTAWPSPTSTPVTGYRVLVFSKTAGYRHDSIAAGIQAIRELGAANGFTVDTTEDAGAFSDANLARYAAVVWLITTGDVLDASQQAAFERYIRSGKGYVGVHAAADTEYDWPWYGNLVGAYFNGHPAIQSLAVRVEDPTHPSMAGIPARWVRTDEPYNYNPNPRSRVHVLANYDESSYSGGTMGDHPIAWCHSYDGGRSWYTGMGHTVESYTADSLFRGHLLGGIQWAAGARAGSCGGGPQEPTVTPAPGSCTTTNVALGRPATASSTESGSYPAANAVDGSATSRWASQFGDPQWIQVDLGSGVGVCRVRLSWEAAYGSAYQIQGSQDGATWSTIKTVTGENGGLDDHTGLNATARYLRIYGTTRGTQYGYSLWELEVFTR